MTTEHTEASPPGGDPNSGFHKALASFAVFFIFLEIYSVAYVWFAALFSSRYSFNAAESELLAWVALGLLCTVIYHFMKAISPFVLVPFVFLFEFVITRLPFLV